MHAVFWALLGAGAILWPSRVSGPLDGMPLDQPAEVFLFGVVLPVLALATPATLGRRAVRGLIVALLAWKALSGATLVQDGWCVRFETPAPLFREMGVVPHSWDVRADWRSSEPRCSAIVDRPYPSLYTFPVWFYNLPPASDHAATDADRPPLVRLAMTVSGTLHAAAPGVLRVDSGEDMQLAVAVDGVDRGDAGGVDIPIAAGTHEVRVTSQLQGERWRFEPLWNGGNLWSQSMATTSPPSLIDRLARPWARFIPLVVVAMVLFLATADLVRGTGPSHAWLPAATVTLFTALGRMSGTAIRLAPAVLAAAAALVPAPLQNTRGFILLVAAPFLAWFGARAAGEAGVVMFYTSGDDWWMFQRFAYRIYMQGYWLEGGQPTFWFQPLYRWIAGALHMVFGDSSAGELVWDAWCVLAGGWFAFAVVRGIGGFRWGIVAAATTLLLFTIGPAWYLFGRGLSEVSSMGLLYAAALLLLQRRQSWGVLILAGVLATLAFYTRLNNLPAVLAVAAFALPTTVPVSMLWQPRRWFARASKPALAAVMGAIAAGLWFFTWRTYHFTGIPNMLHGTQAGPLAVWQGNTEGLSALENTTGSLLMVLFMSDPPRFDLRALPIVVGVGAAVLGLVGAPVARRLPMNVVALCLAGVAGSLIARGTAYPGRFSVHIIPAAVALAVCMVVLLAARRRETTQ